MLGGIDVGYKGLDTWDNSSTKNSLSGDVTVRSQTKAKDVFDRSVEKLASGLRINRAADDAAGLSITEKLKSMIKGSSTAIKAIGDGLSAVSTASAGVGASTENLQKMRELALQASSGTLSDTERASLNDEFTALKGSLDDNAQVAFNGKKLLDGSTGTMSIVTNAEGGSTNLDFSNDYSSGGLGLGATAIGTQSDAEAAIDDIDTAIESLSNAASTFGANENSLQGYSDRLDVSIENMEATKSRIEDTDYAKVAGTAVQGYIQQMMSAGLNSRTGMNSSNVLNFLPSSSKLSIK